MYCGDFWYASTADGRLQPRAGLMSIHSVIRLIQVSENWFGRLLISYSMWTISELPGYNHILGIMTCVATQQFGTQYVQQALAFFA